MNAQTDTIIQSLGLEKSSGRILSELIERAKACFGDDLRSIVLFGSAAEKRLRSTSDINLLFVIRSFERMRVDQLRESLRTSHAAIRSSVMFLLDSELPRAAELFAVKFVDMAKRNIVLFGEDCLAGLTVSREAKKGRLLQVLLNLKIRLRERYAMMSLREEQLARVIAESAGPLRSAAAMILDLEGKPALKPKEALVDVALALGGDSMKGTLEKISIAREKQVLPAGSAPETLFAIMGLVEKMISRIEEIK